MRDAVELKKALVSYKNTPAHRKAAEKSGRLQEFLMCQTLTRAKKIVYGEKTKNYSGSRPAQPKRR